MFVGHYGPAYAAKAAEPRLSLGVLFLATQTLDIVWTALNLLGIEHTDLDTGLKSNPQRFLYFPLSHGLTAALAWSVVAYIVCRLVLNGTRTEKHRAALILAATVGSHWVLDLLVHRPDMPIVGNTIKVGLGLWEHPVIAFLVESGVLLAGLIYYLWTTTPRTRIVGRYGTAIFGASLLAMNAFAIFGPPPSDMKANAIGALVSYGALAGIATWLSRHRQPRMMQRVVQPAVSVGATRATSVEQPI
jgi:hypothetical protein